MGLEGFNQKPNKIKKAILDGDTEFLRAAGMQGAHVAHEKRILQADLAAALAAHAHETRAAEEYARLVDANEHIITPDGEDLDFNANE